jgi:RimJ/RimL family protein N-acetyltransferase
MLPAQIVTPRLILVALTPALLQAERMQPTLLAHLLDAEVPSSWPPEHREPHVFAFMQKQYAEAPQTLGWHRYMLYRGERLTLIGAIGAHAPSVAEAEIGYSLLQPWQGAGLATEGVQALVAALFRDGTLQAITAQTFPHLAASVRVLEKCGFAFAGAGDEPGTVRYRLERSSHAPPP